MKTYEVEFSKKRYLNVDVDANNEDKAIEQAFEKLCIEGDARNEWELEYVRECEPCS